MRRPLKAAPTPLERPPGSCSRGDGVRPGSVLRHDRFVPPPGHKRTRILPLDEAWDLLATDANWEIVERYRGGRVLVGTPPIRPRPQVGAVGVALTSPNAQEGKTGIQTETPQGPAGARWVADRQEALSAFEERLRTYAELTSGDERIFRVKLLVDGDVLDDQLIAVGEISSDPEVLDGLSLTYIGVLATIALSFAFGLQNLSTVCRVLVGLVIFFGLALLLRASASRRVITRFARWALPGAHDPST